MVVHPVAKAAQLEEMRELSMTWKLIFESNKAAERESMDWEDTHVVPVLPERAQ
jgi:hypothetical protein